MTRLDEIRKRLDGIDSVKHGDSIGNPLVEDFDANSPADVRWLLERVGELEKSEGESDTLRLRMANTFPFSPSLAVAPSRSARDSNE